MKKLVVLAESSSVAFLLTFAAPLLPGAALPDLTIYAPALNPHVVFRTFASNDCTVGEGCVQPGSRRLLSFTTQSRNIGLGDLVLGNPATNSAFVFDPCHNHYHYYGFAEYRLRDTNYNLVTLGKKIGFCLEDVLQWDPTARTNRLYDCNYQGIQAGWADVYAAGLPCQYIDITGVPPGDYVLRLAINPAGLLPEADTNNNVTLVPVTIPPVNCLSAPANDTFANAINVNATLFSFMEFNECASKQAGEPNHAGDPWGHSLWFTWTPTSNQTAVITTKRSDFDTLLAVYTGNSVSTLSLVASNDDIIYGTYQQSYLSFPARGGTTYRIAVDGYAGAVGTVVLNVNPPGNDDFTNAYPISGTLGWTNGFSIGASKEPYEPAHAFDVGGHSVWYKWTAPFTGPVEV